MNSEILQFLSDKIIQNIISVIVKEIDPNKIILFGSRARGEQDLHSDYDICVLKKKESKEKETKLHSSTSLYKKLESQLM